MTSPGPPAASGDRFLPIAIGIGAISFLVAISLAIFGDEFRPLQSTGSDSYSRSAIGHHALAELLEELGHPVSRSRSVPPTRTGDGALWIVAEPRPGAWFEEDENGSESDDRTEQLLGDVEQLVWVLPKWTAVGERATGHVERATRKPLTTVEQSLRPLHLTIDIRRVEEPGPFRWTEGAEDLLLPSETGDPRGTGADGVVRGEPPRVAIDEIQLFPPDDPKLDPILECREGSLIAEVKSHWRRFPETRILLVADPDLVANHTLSGENDHGWIVASLVAGVVGPGGPVVFEEVVHGFAFGGSFWRQLFEFPFVFVTVQILGVALLLGWSAYGRFGRPRLPSTGLEAGWRPLTRNASRLLRFGRHSGRVLDVYFQDIERGLANDLHAPPHSDRESRRAWLEGILRHRGLVDEFEDVRRSVDELRTGRASEHQVLRVARRLHRLRQDLLHGNR